MSSVAFAHGSKSRLYLDGLDITTIFKSMTDSLSVDEADTTTFNPAGAHKSSIPGLLSGEASADGFFDGTTGGIATTGTDYALNSRVGLDGLTLVYLPQGDGFGNVARMKSGSLTKYEVKTGTDAAGEASFAFVSDVATEPGVVEHVLQAETVSGQSSSIDNGAVPGATQNGGVGYLEVTTITGTTPSLTAKIQHSADNVSWADLITFTAATAIGGQRVAVAGTVNRYTRALWTIAGTTPSVTFSLVFGRK